MPGTFFGYPIIAQTKNFLITSDDNADATERAQAIALICESDLTKLEKIFNTNFQTGDTHDYGTWVHVVAPGAGNGADNYGFEDSQSSRIRIFGTYNNPPVIPPDPLAPIPLNPAYIRKEYACFLFIAELAEILMDFTGRAWYRGDSSGEGLSIYLGTMLHPNGYYGGIASPRVNAWLKADRLNQDWISATEKTDSNSVSNGCALLFIYYLVNQLGYPIEKVISNYPPRLVFVNIGTLAMAFANLTGQPATNAFSQFNNLIAKHLPFGQPVFVAQDNIFPLRDPDGRSIYMGQARRTMTINRDSNPEQYNVQAGLFCAEKSYSFFRVTETDEYAVFAGSRGILNAAFKWKLNGIELPTHGKGDTIVVPAEKSIRTPDGKIVITGNTITINYGIIDSWNKSELFIYTTESSGNCDLIATALTTEAAINDAEVSADEDVSINPISFESGVEYSNDRRRCNPFYARIDDSLYGLSTVLSNLKNRPDPPSENMIIQLIDAVARVETDAQYAAHAAGISRKELFKELQTPGALFSNEPRVSNEILKLIRPNLQDTTNEINSPDTNID
jgi:hypothetical protein